MDKNDTPTEALVRLFEEMGAKFVEVRHPNRPNAKKDKKQAACGLCKPHKRGKESNFKAKEKQKRKD